MFDTSLYTTDNPQFSEEDIKKSMGRLLQNFTIEASGEHEKTNLKPEQCWWFPWIILRPFFQSKGYTLYNYDPQHPTRVPDFRGPPAVDSFGLYGDRTILPSSHMRRNPTIFGARDRQNRDVVIKFVDKYSPDHPEGTIEYQILRFLNTPSMRSDPRNATVPALEFLEFYDWKFIVMPFHNGCDEYVFLTAYECLDFACQVLEALSFLHEHRIAHLDISQENIMMNYHGVPPPTWNFETRTKLVSLPDFRTTFPIKYSFIDFGNSAYFLPGLPGRNVDGRFKHDPFAADAYQTRSFSTAGLGCRIIYPEVPGLLEILQDMSSLHAPDRISMAVAATRTRVLYDKMPPHETLPRHIIEFENYYYVPRSKFRYCKEYSKWYIWKHGNLF
ncbi:hypothetical protein BJ912DRAFT_989514 [Pholiota molesta]|nr:hypothetical protein BJ912DRAFT_989514 [Pholiota molesta]